MRTPYSVCGHWAGEYDEAGVEAWAANLRSQLETPQVTLGLVFMTPQFFPHAAQVLETLRLHARVPLLVGCSSESLVCGRREIEEKPGLVLGLYYLPGAKLTAKHFTQTQVDSCTDRSYWHEEMGVTREQTNGWLVFADPFNLDAENWLKQWNAAYAPVPVIGGLASGVYQERNTQVYLNGDVFEEGGVAVSVSGDVEIAGVISQGCTPIGETWTITRTDGNLIFEIGNRPAYSILTETFEKLPDDEKSKLRGNLFVGLVINEYLEEFHRGDFLIRNLVGGDPGKGVLVVAAYPRAGQTIQFQRRDAAAATEDMTALLERVKTNLKGRTIYGGSLHCCNGRGTGLFGEPNHDAMLIQRELGSIALTGFFCNGEIGPIGDKNFLHGYTASLALFVSREPKGAQS
ncbi:MAG: hypothetical protein K0Q55_557 [Verrucomicrobia bacterium]|jgi:small ligand-binding sensory domain FIST|nr:hypothetical protein [Verrucomicrobiota bacterium]